MIKKPLCFVLLLVLLIVCSCRESPPVTGVIAKRGMVVTEHMLASEVGVNILQKGGNAFDAAIAVQFTLTVVLPMAGNISGGGFMIYRKRDGETGFLDYRERAPLKAYKDMYLDDEGNPIPGLSTEGILSSGIPGSVAGMVEIHKKFGKLSFSELIEPAIALARNGHAITPELADRLNIYKNDFIRINDAEGHFEDYPFLKNEEWQGGDTLYFTQLAETLDRMIDNPYDAFYLGEVGKQLVEAVEKRGGIFSVEDMQNYKAIWRKPVINSYKDYKIISAAPPSSGGVALLQILYMSSLLDVKSKQHNSPEYIHLITEIENRIFADRSEHLGDPDFFTIPVEELTRKSYLQARVENIDAQHKTPVDSIKPGKLPSRESMETTHFSIVDEQGNAVSITTTLNAAFGSKVFLPELGVFMNNEMDDFSKRRHSPNNAGLLGGEFNAIAPEKRMLSSMTPTIVEEGGQLKMVLGSPGGPTIITSVAQTALNVLEFGMTMQEAVNAPRFHSQWYPDQILMEERLSKNNTMIEQLAQMGHANIKPIGYIGKVQAIRVLDNGLLEGAADTIRSTGRAIGLE